MNTTFIKIAWRSLYANRVFSVINMISLAVGISVSMLIVLIVYYDFSFDKFHAHSNRIYRLTTDFYSKEGNFHNYGVSVPLADALKSQGSGLEQVTALYTSAPYFRVKEGKTEHKNLEKVTFADDAFFNIFNYQWLAGSKKSALSAPNRVVLTKSRAEKYLPGLSAQQMIGKTLVYDDSVVVSIAGIVADLTKPTDLVFQEFLSAKTAYQSPLRERLLNSDWRSTTSASQVFVKLKPHASPKVLQAQLDKLANEHVDKEALRYGQTRKFHMQPLADIHFNKDYGTFDYGKPVSEKPLLYGLTGIAIFLLLLGCINFINLSTAQATYRAKEIGVRKTLGSSKKQLIVQFLGETFLLTLFSALISIGLSALLVRYFEELIPQDFSFSLIFSPVVLLAIAALIVLVTLASGFYPAVVLTRFKPVSVLKGQTAVSQKSALRRFLTVSQFVIAQVFIIATVLVSKQIHYMLNKDMGFAKNAVVYINLPYRDTSITKRMVYLEKIRQISQVQKASLGGATPASFVTNSWPLENHDGKKTFQTDVQMLFGDRSYLDLYKLKLLAGRNIRTDTTKEYLINETLARRMGFKNPADAVGRMLSNPERPLEIVGVLADFNMHSLHTPIQPMAFGGDMYRKGAKSQFRTIHLALNPQSPESWKTALKAAEKVWKDIYPEDEFKADFVDDTIGRFYEKENRLSKLLNSATVMSVLISGLGLLGLVIYTTERRTKEIGIRKVLGASVFGLVRLLSYDFILLVLLAFLIAAPVAWWGLHNWLQNYAYKTSMSWWVFALSAALMAGAAILIMSIRTFRTALANPVASLRNE